MPGCENTDMQMVTEAGMDGVKALTISDKDVEEISSQSARYSDQKHTLAPPGTKYADRLNQLVGQNLQDGVREVQLWGLCFP